MLLSDMARAEKSRSEAEEPEDAAEKSPDDGFGACKMIRLTSNNLQVSRFIFEK